MKNLGLTSLIFLVGFSVYLYLPIRSMAEPLIDWGNPETFQGFFDQVTDRRHAELHFSELNEPSSQDQLPLLQSLGLKTLSGISKVNFVFTQLVRDLARQFTWMMVIGFIGGAILCARKNLPLFLFLFLITAVNASFFVGWREESYFPSYIVACLWAAIFYYWLLCEKLGSQYKEIEGFVSSTNGQQKKTARFSVVAILGACTLWLVITNFFKVDRSNSYFAETLLKKELLSLDDESILVTEISWFNMAYHLDVMRLRDDVALVKAADFLEADPPSFLTSKRYPYLQLPDQDKHRFDSRENAFNYMMEFFRNNAENRPVIIEQNWILFKEFPLAEELLPHRNLLLKFPSYKKTPNSPSHSLEGFNEFKDWLEEELKKPGLQREPKWISKIIFYLPSFADHFHATARYKEEREVLKVLYDFLGLRGPEWHLKMVDNLILDGKKKEGKRQWEEMRNLFPEKYQTYLAEGLVLKSEEQYDGAIRSFNHALETDPDAFRPNLEKSLVWLASGNKERTLLALRAARGKLKTLKELKQIRNVEQFLETTS